MGDWDRYVGNNGEIPESWFAPDSEQSSEIEYDLEKWRREQDGILRFDSFDDALDWARKNPGKAITRSPDGNGFVAN